MAASCQRYTWLFIVLIFTPLVYSWDPDAGIVRSWTKIPGATVQSSTSPASAARVIDGNDNTNWVSGACLPSGYVNRTEVNILKGKCQNNYCTVSKNSRNDIAMATDGNFYTTSNIETVNGRAEFAIQLNNPTFIRMLSVWGVYHDDTKMSGTDGNGNVHILKVLSTSDSYKEVKIISVPYNITEIHITSASNFGIKEIAALGIAGCMEQVTVDLGTVRSVGVIRTRHWAGVNASLDLTLKTSVDGQVWDVVSALDPNALHSVVTELQPRDVRYISLEYNVVLKNYMKVYCWEIDAWDQNHQWGSKQTPKPHANTVRAILGVNGIWGWGHNQYSDSIARFEGPELYSKVASHARNYHNLDWDVTDPDNDPEFDEMGRGGGTQAKGWLNWDKEYKAWNDANLTVDSSVQFTKKSFAVSTWNFPQSSAFNYGAKFASHFGPAIGNGLIKAMEVGNEPWDYDADFYATILKSMAAGVRSVDTTIDVLPGAFQAHDIFDTGNYIGTRVKEQFAGNISVINFHTYSFRTNDKGIRIATYPEDPASSFNSIRNINRWRDVNMPQTPIWVTEWGWDSDGGNEDCTFPECVSEKAQALYGIRGLLILTRYNFEKVTWFFYANSDYCNTLFCRSGLTASKINGFRKKAVFDAFQSLLGFIGDKHFLHTMKEDEDGYVYAFGDQNNNGVSVTHFIAWKPVNIAQASTFHLSIPIPTGKYPSSVKRFTGNVPATEGVEHCIKGDLLSLEISPSPVIIELSHINIGNIVGR